MIMRIRGFELEIEILENSKTVLTILNKPLYRSTIMKLQKLLENEDINDIVIEEENKILNYDKDVILLTDYYNIDFNNKTLTNALYKKVEAMFVSNSDYYMELELLYKKLSHYLQNKLLDCEIDMEFKSELDILDLLKMVDLKIDLQNDSDCLDNLFSYLDMLAYLRSKKLLIFSNLKTNFSKEEIISIYKYAEYKKLKWLCIENVDCDSIDSEKKYLIDEDLIEFDYSK